MVNRCVVERELVQLQLEPGLCLHTFTDDDEPSDYFACVHRLHYKNIRLVRSILVTAFIVGLLICLVESCGCAGSEKVALLVCVVAFGLRRALVWREIEMPHGEVCWFVLASTKTN